MNEKCNWPCVQSCDEQNDAEITCYACGTRFCERCALLAGFTFERGAWSGYCGDCMGAVMEAEPETDLEMARRLA